MQLSKPKHEHEFGEDMEQDVMHFLFNHYRVHFQSWPALAEAYACIPQINQWDDHDIWGELSRKIEQCTFLECFNTSVVMFCI